MITPTVVLIEGLDLAGKTTVWQAAGDLIESHGISVRRQRNALCANNVLAARADGMRKNPDRDIEQVSNLFLQAHRWDSDHFDRPGPRTVHLQDSCWMRTLAFCRFAGDQRTAALLANEAGIFPAFDQAYFLTASIERRKERFLQRQMENPDANDAGDAWVISRPQDFLRLERALEDAVKEFLPVVKIDTTDLCVDQIASIIIGGILKP